MTHHPTSDSFDTLLREALMRRHKEMTRLVPRECDGHSPGRPAISRLRRGRADLWRAAAAVVAVALAVSMWLLRPEAPTEPAIVQAPPTAPALPREELVEMEHGNEEPESAPTAPVHIPQQVVRCTPVKPEAVVESPSEAEPRLQAVTVPEGWQPVDPRRQVAEILTASLAMADEMSAPVSLTTHSLHDE